MHYWCNLLDKFISFVLGLIGVYIGWKLSWKTIVKQNSAKYLQDKFNALSEIKSVVDNIPPHLTKEELCSRLQEEQFRKRLTGRLVRLFGLRNELISYIEQEFVELIDTKLRPLFISENGHYNFKDEKIDEFVDFSKDIVLYVQSLEKRLKQEQKESQEQY